MPSQGMNFIAATLLGEMDEAVRTAVRCSMLCMVSFI